MFGKLYGRDNFARSISPKKTVQGVMGAIFLPVFFMIVLYGVAWASDGKYALKIPFLEYVGIGVIGAILSILGDLIESFLKRCSNVKDSGTLLAGHGGILDRIDSTLLVLPRLYWYALNYQSELHSPKYDFDNVNLWAFLHF